MALTCIDNLIGLSSKDCNCFDLASSTDWTTRNTSTSGHYVIDDSDYGAPLLDAIFKASDCEDADSLPDLLYNVRAAAIRQLEADLLISLNEEYGKTTEGIIREIAQRRNGLSTITPQRANAGIQLMPERVRDRSFVLQEIWTGMDTTAAFDVTVTSTNPDWATQTIPVTSVANTWTKTDGIDLEIPFWTDADVWDTETGDRLLYDFTYEVNGMKCFRNEITLGCCSNKTNKYGNYLTANGVSVETVDVPGRSYANYAYGLVLKGYVKCDELAWVCNLTEASGYDAQIWLAMLLKYKTGEILAQHVLDSGKLNFYTTLSREATYGKRNHLRALYADHLAGLVSALPRAATGCYECKQQWARRRL